MSLAILNGSYKTIKLLAEWGETLDTKDAEGNTYLHLAAMSGHVNIFLFFLSHQISIQSKNIHGKTPMEMAKIYRQDHLLKYLRENFDDSQILSNIVTNK
jgi:ankyrin repeat protein